MFSIILTIVLTMIIWSVISIIIAYISGFDNEILLMLSGGIIFALIWIWTALKINFERERRLKNRKREDNEF